MRSAPGLSLWLRPDDAARERLAAIIRELSATHATPVFDPHVTLLGGIERPAAEVIEHTQALARRLAHLEVELEGLGTTAAYFRCVFAEARASEALMNAHRQAREAFGIEPAEPYHPHLSLIYGDLDQAMKERTVTELGASLDTRFWVEQIDIIDTGGAPPAAWERVAWVALGDGG